MLYNINIELYKFDAPSLDRVVSYLYVLMTQ